MDNKTYKNLLAEKCASPLGQRGWDMLTLTASRTWPRQNCLHNQEHDYKHGISFFTLINVYVASFLRFKYVAHVCLNLPMI